MTETTSVINWWDAVVLAVSDAWVRILSFLPNLIGALVVLLIGLLIAYALKWILVQVLNAIRFELFAKRIKLSDVLDRTGVKQSSTDLLGNLVKWIVIIVFLMPALEILGMAQVSDILSQVLSYLPNVVVAGFLVFIGLIVTDLVANLIKGTAVAVGSTTASVLAAVARYSILVFIGIMALGELGVATTFLLNLFTGIVAMVAIAGGLAFGLGGKDAAADLIKKIREDLSKK